MPVSKVIFNCLELLTLTGKITLFLFNVNGICAIGVGFIESIGDENKKIKTNENNNTIKSLLVNIST
jgi:hypothetical protein